MNARIKKVINTLGIPRLIIIGLLVVILIAMPILGLQIEMLYTQAFGRIGMYMILVLAMVPAIESGIKMNMALPLGNFMWFGWKRNQSGCRSNWLDWIIFCNDYFDSNCSCGWYSLWHDPQ